MRLGSRYFGEQSKAKQSKKQINQKEREKDEG
jgi:hypothetical protein